MKTLNKTEAIHVANIFSDYFDQFNRIDQYMRDQKMAQIETIPAPLPGMGLDSDMFDDFTMSPEVMDLEVIELGNEIWDTCINMISSHSNMVSIPGKTLEALIGAIYLEQGLDVVENFILKLWRIDLNSSLLTFVDSKTKLQEYSLKKFKVLPVYKLLNSSGPKHKPIFKVGVRLKNSEMVSAVGNSKKDAQQKAATILLKNIGKK